MNLLANSLASGWVFLTPATILIAVMAFWPMIQAFIMSLSDRFQREHEMV